MEINAPIISIVLDKNWICLRPEGDLIAIASNGFVRVSLTKEALKELTMLINAGFIETPDKNCLEVGCGCKDGRSINTC